MSEEFIDLAMDKDWALWVNRARDKVFFSHRDGGSFTVLYRAYTGKWLHGLIDVPSRTSDAFQKAMECQAFEEAIRRTRLLLRLSGLD